MRIVLNMLTVLMVAALLAAGAWHWQGERVASGRLEEARSERARLQREINVHASLRNVQYSDRGYPLIADPNWFKGNLPRNPLLPNHHPWIEIAGEEQRDLLHPEDRIATRPDQARFWYNPATGRVRARVPAYASDAETLRAYNFVNESMLRDLFSDEETPIVDVPVPPVRGRR